ncbi:M48 family metallopeptidase [Denitromonas ohlonensis]|uniref:M48 family metalloprotease n=2 Tax=Denitromonas TaxID=139331 RepID=A0A557SP15_9RHOO|nr:M48 family metallopeptidase [Denitromonas ohlonensis]TVO67086.1 M48 family metalloprotease [Denitromonas ohlonensis]TVO79146.1 M48 family metalloprotease [Denitromonas ohlonensis]
MTRIRPRSSATVRRLARRLSWRAAGALTVLALASVASVGLAVVLMIAVVPASAGTPMLQIGVAGLAAALVWGAVRIVRWLLVPAPRAEGVRIDRHAAPALYRLLDNLAERMGAESIQTIRISSEMNAAVFQRPRWGYWGAMDTTLIIGLPLVHSVSPRQLAAILAHELAHLNRQRGGWPAWGAHVRAWWHRVCERIAAEDSWLAQWVDRGFARWAEADLMAAVRLNHLEEYEADRLAARIVGSKLLGDTLVEVAMKANFIETDYWDAVMSQAAEMPRPSLRPFRDMGMGVAAGFHAAPQHRALHSLVCEDSGLCFHPTLTDRLVALGVAPRVPEPDAHTAASHYLQRSLPRLSRVLDRRWWRAARQDWRRYYASTMLGSGERD